MNNEKTVEQVTENVTEAAQTTAPAVQETAKKIKKINKGNAAAVATGFAAGVLVIAGAKPAYRGIKWVGGKIVGIFKKKPEVVLVPESDEADEDTREVQ